ncbi:Tracheary Element Differentiation-related 4 [Hibiscus trionum]|uniref:Tracheary Element Differentiation-related 4 n=1 Tax=Hibiscus trionum TaxID=183268 RepID=A0A9W7HBP9_HIBTR|nr:Tracheary Element Differentiation-related 4 [Hibiscus trionum]
MKRVSLVALCAVVMAVVMFSGETRTAEAVTCNPTELSPCMPAFTSSADPSAACCSKLNEQQPCLCGYIKNPALKPYVDSPNAKRVASYCKIPWPQC